MKNTRISIIGNSGSGKSTIARSLAATHALPTLDLDTVAWEPGKIAVARDAAAATSAVTSFCEAAPHWIVEGCYGNLVAATLQYSPVLLFVEPGVDVCLAHCRARPWEPHKYPSKEEQDSKLDFLLAWVWRPQAQAGETTGERFSGRVRDLGSLVATPRAAGVTARRAASPQPCVYPWAARESPPSPLQTGQAKPGRG